MKILGDSCEGIIIHSYRDTGHNVIVNYEIRYRDSTFISRTTIEE